MSNKTLQEEVQKLHFALQETPLTNKNKESTISCVTQLPLQHKFSF